MTVHLDRSDPRVVRSWTEDEVKQALWLHFTNNGWNVLEEVALLTEKPSTGYGVRQVTRRIDVLAIREPVKPVIGGVHLGPMHRVAVEVKVSRQDFLADVRRPEKQAPWREVTHQHAYAVPEGLVAPEEVPQESGLLVVGRASWHAGVRWARKAPYTDAGPVPTTLIHHLAARAADAEAKQRGRYGSVLPEDPAVLRAELERAHKDREKETRRWLREAEAAKRWRQIAVAGGYPIACETCGHPVRPVNVRHRDERWRHTYPEHDADCLAQRMTHPDTTTYYTHPIRPREDTDQ